MELDYVRYVLLFPNTELIIYNNGDCGIGKWEHCRHLDGCLRCKVHYSPEQPRTCFYYNAHLCWYKKNFVTETPVDLTRLNLARFDAWVREIYFDSNGTIISVPTIQRLQEIIRPIPMDNVLTLLPDKGFESSVSPRA